MTSCDNWEPEVELESLRESIMALDCGFWRAMWARSLALGDPWIWFGGSRIQGMWVDWRRG